MYSTHYTPLALGTIKTWNIYRDVYHFANLFYFIKKEKSFLHNGVISFKKLYLSIYHKVVSRNTSWLVAHSSIFRLFMKGKFYAYAL